MVPIAMLLLFVITYRLGKSKGTGVHTKWSWISPKHISRELISYNNIRQSSIVIIFPMIQLSFLYFFKPGQILIRYDLIVLWAILMGAGRIIEESMSVKVFWWVPPSYQLIDESSFFLWQFNRSSSRESSGVENGYPFLEFSMPILDCSDIKHFIAPFYRFWILFPSNSMPE